MAIETSQTGESEELDPRASVPIDLPYEYSSLPRDNIRIVIIQAGQGNEPLELRVDEVPLSNTGDYAALSYAWEGQAANVAITIEGRLSYISRNVYEALYALRKEELDVRVWVDAICINQADIQERNYQVRVMGHIYTSCEVVVVWLGDADKHTESMIATTYLVASAEHQFYHNTLPATFDYDGFLTEEQTNALFDFFTRPWFSRLWIFQEYILGKRVILTIGSYEIESSQLYAASKWVFREWGIGNGLANFLNAHESRMIYQSPDRTLSDTHFSLKFILMANRSRLATDPRDKLFGLLGLASGNHGVVADYTKSKAEVFTEVGRFLLLESESLVILGSAQGSPDCPSWVPDWSHNFNSSKTLESGFNELHPFHASLNSKRRMQVSHDSPSEISFQGKIIDTIVRKFYYVDFLPSKITRDSGSPFENLFYSILEHFCNEGVYPFTGETYEDAYLKTIMADLSQTSPRTNEYFHYTYFPAAMKKQALNVPCPDELESKVQQELLDFVLFYAKGRAMFQTSKGYIGIMPERARVGDTLCLFLGGDVLYILRPEDVEGKYKFIGECYAHGLMDGEALDGVDVDTEVFETFTLV